VNWLADYESTFLKPATREVGKQPIRCLKEFFGEDRSVEAITEGDADDFRLWLLRQDLAKTTVAKRLQFARQFFKDAKKRKLVVENVFQDVSEKQVVEKQLEHFVTRDEVQRLLSVCDQNWKTIIGLSRYAGLRCPTEVLSLRIDGIDWQDMTMRVYAPKTEHHEGKAWRTVPIFDDSPLPELLRDACEAAAEGAEYVVGGGYLQRARTNKGWRNCNLNTQLKRLIRRAGMEPWAGAFHAMRAARQTELMERHPIHTVTYWLGNSPKIALQHYARVRDNDWERATGVQRAAKCAARRASHGGSQKRTEKQKATQVIAPPSVVSSGVPVWEPVHNHSEERTGFEPADQLTRSRI